MIGFQSKNLALRIKNLLKLNPYFIQSASITGRASRGGPLKLPPPFPYEDKPFEWYHGLTDKTILRISEENAKIIVVEGPIGVGKSAFAKALAEQLDMYFMPQPTMDFFYVLPSGLDLRQFDHELPKIVQSYDHKNFCVDPKDDRAGIFQFKMLYARFFQYFDALAHILNTGQGVILERSYYSDYVFLEAMHKNKYISTDVKNMYYYVRKNTKNDLKEPHLIIYLDIPVSTVQERICRRNLSHEQNSPALTKQYLESLERLWKEDYLKNASKKSEILVYNWIDGGDVEIVVEDIEKIDFDFNRRDKKFLHWRIPRKELDKMRYRYTNMKSYYENHFKFPYYKVPEFNIPSSVLLEEEKILQRLPECQYDFGYNPLIGDSIWSILFSTKTKKHRHTKAHLYFHDKQDDM